MRGHWMTWIRGWITRQSWRLSQKPQVQVLIQWVILWPCLGQTNSHTENLGPSYSCVGALLCSWFSVQTIMKLLFMSSCAYCGYLMQQGPDSSQTGYSVYKPTLGRFVLQRRVRADFMWLLFFFTLKCLQSDLNYLQKQTTNESPPLIWDGCIQLVQKSHTVISWL